MAAHQQVNQYLKHYYEGMNPEQLILLLYNGALSRLRLTREGIKENDVKKKGKNLSKAIAIISELNVSVDSKMDHESTQFLRGLYTAILTQLPKIALNNDLNILKQAETYIVKLKEVWEKDVMAEKRGSIPTQVAGPADKQALPPAFNENSSNGSSHSISV